MSMFVLCAIVVMVFLVFYVQ